MQRALTIHHFPIAAVVGIRVPLAWGEWLSRLVRLPALLVVVPRLRTRCLSVIRERSQPSSYRLPGESKTNPASR